MGQGLAPQILPIPDGEVAGAPAPDGGVRPCAETSIMGAIAGEGFTPR